MLDVKVLQAKMPSGEERPRFHAGKFQSTVVKTYISVSSPWLLLHQLQSPGFTLPAKQFTTDDV